MPATLDDITIITINRPLVAGNIGATNAEWVTLNTNVNTILARPAIDALGDVPDVDTATTAPVAGDTLVYDDADSTWKPGSAAGALDEIEDNGAVVNSVPVTKLWANEGLSASEVTPGTTEMSVRFGGTGSQVIAARSDHYHTTDTVTRVPTSASGYLSSGTRSLGSTNVTLLSGITYVVEAEVKGQMRGSDVGPGYYRLSVTINGNTRQSPSMGYWTVQGVPDKYTWDHERTIAGTGAFVTVSASVAYESGAGFNVDYSELKITLRPRS